jgi:hypothetical protein
MFYTINSHLHVENAMVVNGLQIIDQFQIGFLAAGGG